MKKLSILAACALALSCLLAACTKAPTDPTQSDESPAQTDAQTSAQTAVQAPDENGKLTYTVTVTDQNGASVAGATVQMCTATSCLMPTTTGENGPVTYTLPPPDYHVTVVSCPDGYTADTTQEFHFDNSSTTLTVAITKE